MSGGWIGVDFDGTLAMYQPGTGGVMSIGAPIKPMVDRVKKWLANGETVKIFTARVGASGGTDNEEFAYEQRVLIKAWCVEQFGVELEVTATKDFGMRELYDDRAVQVEMNTGKLIGHSTRGL